MNKILHALAAVTLAAAVPASSALAQDGSEEVAARTPEAAQAFLSTYLQRGGWVARAFNWFDGSNYRYFDGSWVDAPSLKHDWQSVQSIEADITGWEALDECSTRVNGSARQISPKYLEEPGTPLAPKGLVVRIDWANVNPIVVKDDTGVSKAQAAVRPSLRYVIYVWDPKTHSGIALLNRDKTIADRAAFALSYLQQHCDPTAGSAF